MATSVMQRTLRGTLPSFVSQIGRRCYVKLAEVGRLDSPRESKYETGQLFLHRVFGYRGVTLFPWTARVYDRDQSTGRDSASEAEPQVTEAFLHPRIVNGQTQIYYQVLIDLRDCPFVRTQTEAVTFLGNQDNSKASLYSLPGLDYVSHEDILPYTATNEQMIQHELFDKFLMPEPHKDPPFGPRETLRAWQDKNHPWLELNQVHKETTEDVRVTVMPFYMGSRANPGANPEATVYWWRYCIRLENLSDRAVQLRERHWRIFSQSGTLETVRGRGVVGEEPILNKRYPAFQYGSHVSLQAPSGHMWGNFRMEREDGYMFDCKIPPFSLESKSDPE
ncbi:polymerase delta-interacting protein 2-like [Varroa jacobsoni]|uniref:ApaG domain-containing protein n=1 Tax=Varroa destructor TaxID=109461 RepID=A0A7M7KFG0_VARDE|nr:polymerase delta-interacting protein 2-like [Varroa destructor]XP_022697647.1 polymerase delta-interacting protein 2-like [Varroa jacobsoni]